MRAILFDKDEIKEGSQFVTLDVPEPEKFIIIPLNRENVKRYNLKSIIGNVAFYKFDSVQERKDFIGINI